MNRSVLVYTNDGVTGPVRLTVKAVVEPPK